MPDLEAPTGAVGIDNLGGFMDDTPMVKFVRFMSTVCAAFSMGAMLLGRVDYATYFLNACIFLIVIESKC